jgi:hypothetical protein
MVKVAKNWRDSIDMENMNEKNVVISTIERAENPCKTFGNSLI